MLLFSRSTAEQFSLVGLNFTDADVSVPFTPPRGGRFREQLHDQDHFDAEAGEQRWLTLPSNYGRVWSL